MTLLQSEDTYANLQQWHSELALLAKLQEMVPIMPRERELTKLEIINYVIDYIRQLKTLVVDHKGPARTLAPPMAPLN